MKALPSPDTVFYGQQTSDGGFILTGNSDFPELGNTILIRLDANGDIVWQKTYELENESWWASGGMYVQETQDHGFIILVALKEGPWRYHRGAWEHLILKTNKSGTILWKEIDQYWSYPKETLDGGFIIKSHENHHIIKLLKTDAEFKEEWNISFFNELVGPYFTFIDHQQTKDEGFILTGYNLDNGHDFDHIALMKIFPVDKVSPEISIRDPENGLYIGGNKVLDLRNSIIIFGPINITVEAIDINAGIDYVSITIGEYPNATIFTLTEKPYNVTWNQIVFGKYPIEVVAYDKAGNQAAYEIEVWKFF
jgi:hypothetical protein